MYFTIYYFQDKRKFFNKNEINKVFELIDSGDILIHPNYSILYCRNQELLDDVKNEFGCYEVLIPEKY